MENTKDLVRAERGSRFVCQARGGRLQLPDPRSPRSSLTPLPGLLLHPTPPPPPELPSPSRPLNDSGGVPLPPPPQPRIRRGSLSVRSLCAPWKKTLRRKFSLRPVPSPFGSGWRRGGGEMCDFHLVEPPRVGERRPRFPGGAVAAGLRPGRSLPPPRGRCREAFCTWRWMLKGGGVGTCGRARWEWCWGSSRPGCVRLKKKNRGVLSGGLAP